MKILCLLRHAKSSWKHPELSDHDRPLNGRGKRDAPRMGVLLNELGIQPDVILSSTAKRARRTAAVVAAAVSRDDAVRRHASLYHADPAEMIELLRDLPDDVETAMIVGHNPGCEDLLEQLTGEYEMLPTAALARIELDVPGWGHLRTNTPGRLTGLWRPRELD